MAALSSRALAQQVTVSISPASANTYAPGALAVTVQWCAVGATLDSAMRTLTFNGQNVAPGFGWVPGTQPGCDDYATSGGTVTLGPSVNVMYGRIGASYTPPPPPPECPPICDQRPPPGPSVALESAAVDYVWGEATANWGTSAPIVSLTPYSSGVLAGGFDVVFAHSTPAYFSLGQARGVTVAYNSSTVRPTPVIQFEVSNPAWASPTWHSVQVRRASTGALLTLLNGSPTVYYTPAGATPLRLAVALDAQTNGLGTGWHEVTVTVTSHLASGDQSTTVPTRLLVVDETGNSFGKGVGIAGLQRVRSMLGSGSYSVIVTEGDGSAVFFESSGNCQTCSFVSPAGETSSLSKIENGTMYRRRYPDGSIVDFMSDGRIRRAAGLFGDTTQFIWTDTLLTQIRDPMGKTLTLAYASGKLQSVTDPAGRVTTYSIDGSGRLYRVTDPDTIATNLAYDANDLLASVTDRGGAVTSFTYDALRRVDTTYAPTIQIYTGASVRPRAITRAPERVVWQPERAGTDTTTKKLAVRPDTLYALSIGPRNDTVRTALDRFGGPTKVVGPYGETATITRDTLGRPLVTTEPNGHVTRRSWNAYLVGQAKDSTTGRTISYTYGANSVLTRVSGDVTQQDFVYHTGANGPTGAIDSVLGANRTVIYSVHRPDALGRDTLISDGGQHTTRLKYDSVSGNVREYTGPTGSVTRYHYDAAGRVDSAWVPASGVYTYQYDLLNRQTQVKNPLGHIMRYVYGPTTLSRVIDAKGQVYKFAYNSLGMLVAQHDLGDTLKADTLKYDEAGNVRSVRTRRGDVIALTYDSAGRMRSRSGPDFPVDSFKYDPGGRWMVAWNVNQRDSSAFDQAGRLAATRQAMLGGVAYQLTYTYDIRDRLMNRSAPTGGNVTRYAYNPSSGALDTLCAAAACVAFGRNAELLTDKRTFNPGLGGSWFTSRRYTGLHDVQRDSFSVAGLDTLYGGTWTYDGLGRLDTEDPKSMGTRLQHDYTYDAIGRLTRVCDFDQLLLWCTQNLFTYAYDSTGNRTDPGANAVVGPGNRMQSFAGYALTYDANGATASKAGGGASYTYTWDALGRLTEVRNNDTFLASYKYDAVGRRVAKTLGDGTTERYVYDGDQVILDVTGAHAVKVEYGYYPGVDRLFAVKNTQTAAWSGVVLTDPNVGTVRAIANLSGGSIRKTYGLSVWGTGPADTGVITRFRMAGREYDQESKLYYMRARYYDPELGRFISEDPIGIAGGLNLYRYAGNDPVNGRDPSGLDDGCKEEVQMAALSAGDGITLPPIEVCGQRDGNPTLPPGCPPGATVCYQPPPPPPPGDPNNPMFDPPGNNPQPQPRPVDVGEQAVRKCWAAAGKTVLTGLGDLLFLSGVGAASRLGAKGMSIGRRAFIKYYDRGLIRAGDAAYSDATKYLVAQSTKLAETGVEYEAHALGVAGVIEHSDNPLAYLPLTDFGVAFAEELKVCFNPE